jgi:hypothetical protein
MFPALSVYCCIPMAKCKTHIGVAHLASYMADTLPNKSFDPSHHTPHGVLFKGSINNRF